MVTLQFVMGKGTRTPINVVVQEETGTVAMEQFEDIFDEYIRIANGPDEEDGEDPEGVPGIGTGGSLDIN